MNTGNALYMLYLCIPSNWFIIIIMMIMIMITVVPLLKDTL